MLSLRLSLPADSQASAPKELSNYKLQTTELKQHYFPASLKPMLPVNPQQDRLF
jgi:hypothetical protein